MAKPGRLNLLGRIIVVLLVLALGEVAYLAIHAWSAPSIDIKSILALAGYAAVLAGALIAVFNARGFRD